MVIGHRPVVFRCCPGVPAASHWIGMIESRNEVVASGRQATGVGERARRPLRVCDNEYNIQTVTPYTFLRSQPDEPFFH